MIYKRYSIQYGGLGPGLQNTWLMSFRKPVGSFPFISPSLIWVTRSKPCRIFMQIHIFKAKIELRLQRLWQRVWMGVQDRCHAPAQGTLSKVSEDVGNAGLQPRGLASIPDSFPTHLPSCTGPQTQQLPLAAVLLAAKCCLVLFLQLQVQSLQRKR